MATDEIGLPAVDRAGNLWIRLTVAGVTRIGVGDGNSMKERIGDAIRNAAMRFGVALDLWSKEELESGHVEPQEAAQGQPEPSLPLAVAALRKQARRKQPELDPDSITAFIQAAMEGHGLDRNNPNDVLKLVREWEAT